MTEKKIRSLLDIGDGEGTLENGESGDDGEGTLEDGEVARAE